jgi:hypothetical protein
VKAQLVIDGARDVPAVNLEPKEPPDAGRQTHGILL